MSISHREMTTEEENRGTRTRRIESDILFFAIFFLQFFILSNFFQLLFYKMFLNVSDIIG